MNFIKKRLFSKRILFIDGMGRVGKSMISRIIPHLDKCEQIEFFESLEHILLGLSTKDVSIKFAKSYINNQINLLYYNKKIARRVNFRLEDVSSSKNFNNRIYEKRQKLDENEGKRLFLNENWIHPFFTHDLILNLKYLKKIISNFQILEIYRDPFDVVYSWFNKGWGKRLYDKNEAVDFSLKYKYKNYNLPFYVKGYEKKWINLNEVEKCAVIVKNNIINSINNQKKNKLSNIFTLSYEDFLINPLQLTNHICKFLKTKKNKYLHKSITKNNLPDKISKKIQNKKKEFILDNISRETGKELIVLQENYCKEIYGLKKYSLKN